MEKDHIMEKREPHDAMNLFKEVQQKNLISPKSRGHIRCRCC